MSLFKTVDANSVSKKIENEHRIGITNKSGSIRPNNLLSQTIKKQGGQIKIHLLEQDYNKDYRKGDLFLETVSENGLVYKEYKNKGLHYQSRSAAQLFAESIKQDFKSLNCKVAKEPVFIESLWLYPIITASAIIKN